MKKIIRSLVLLVLLSVIVTSCTIARPLDIPFGKWENTELGLVLDINPDICTPNPQRRGRDGCLFPGTYRENGNLIEIRILFSDAPGGMEILIFRYPFVSGEEVDTFYSVLSHRVEQNRLYLTVFDGTGIVEIVLELIEEYEVG